MREELNEKDLIYMQIAKMLEDDILREVYREEEGVPSTNELARVFNINPATAAKGLNLLVNDGVLYKKRGIGMFVAKGAKGMVREKRKSAFFDSFVKPLVREGKSIGLTVEELEAMLRLAEREGENEV